MRAAKLWALWLWRAWPVWGALAAACLPLYLPWLRNDTAIRFAAAAFQVAGVCLVTAGIGGKVKHFYGVNVHELILRWLRESPASRREPVPISANFTAGGATVSGVVTVEAKIDHLPVDERIVFVHKKVVATDGRVAELAQKTRADVKKLEDSIAAARDAVQPQILSYGAKLGGVLVDGFKTELLGACLLIVGAIFGTLPGEVASLFKP